MHAINRHLDVLIEQIYGAIGRPEVWSDVAAEHYFDPVKRTRPAADGLPASISFRRDRS